MGVVAHTFNPELGGRGRQSLVLRLDSSTGQVTGQLELQRNLVLKYKTNKHHQKPSALFI